MPLTEAAKAKKKKRDDEAHQQAAKSIVNKTVKAADHANKAVSNNTRQPSVSQKTQSTVERLNQKYGRNQSQPSASTVRKPSQTSPKTQKTVDRLNEKYGTGKVTGGKHTYMDDVVDTAKSTLRQVAAEEARAFNASARTLTSKDSYLYASQAEIDAANKRADERDKKFRAKIKQESAEMEKLKNGHSYLGQQGLSAVSSAVGMATDAAWGPAALAHMFIRTQAGSEGNVKEKVEPLKQKLSASGNYSQEEIDEIFKDVDKWDLANSFFEGGIEVLSEKMFGGFGLAKRVGGSGILDKSLAKLGARMGSKATTGVLGRVAKGTAEEVAEEEVGNPLQTLASNLIYGNRMQNINEDATRRELQAQSDAIRSRIQTPEDAQAVATQLGSKEFMADSRNMYLESGMSEKEADELASMTRDYLEASALGDVDRMRELQDEMVKKLAGGENSLKEKWTLQDAIDAAVSTSLMTVTTGVPGAVTNSMMGKSYKDTNGMDAVKNLAKVTKNLDPEKSVRAQAIMDRIDAGEDISGTQVYDLIQWSSEAATESYKREDVKERMADSVMKRENLFVAPSVRNEDGSVTLGEETERRYDEILEENKAKAKAVKGISREDAEIAADVATAFQLGTITANQMNELSSDNLEVREAFHQITGINLNQFDTSVNQAENNIAMQESLFARAADNYIESARIEQEAWNDGARGEVESSITEGLGSNGDVAVHDALNAVDPRDRSTFILMGRASASVYDYARFSEDSWEDVSERLKSMYPSLPQDALKGVYESAKKDKKIAETPYYNAKVKATESTSKFDMSEAEQTEFGKFTNEAQRQLKDSEQIVLQSLAQQFNINIKLLPSKAFKIKSEGKDGKTKVSYSNGAYDPKTGTMILNGGNDMERNLIAVALHEITHHIATYAPEEYIKLSNRVMDRWYKNDSAAFKEAIQRKQAEYKKAVKQDLSEEQALEEIIADAVGEMHSDSKFIEQICREEPTLAEKIINAIKDVLRKLREILSSGRISEEYEDAFFAQLDMWDEAQRLWMQAAKVAQQNRANQMIDDWDANARQNTPEEETVEEIAEDLEPKERFSVDEPIERVRDLIAVHNLKPQDLLNTFDLGGFPMPSIAVTKDSMGHDLYGDITLMFNSNTIDPQFNRNNQVFGGDAWTPTFPTIRYKHNEKVTDKIRDLYYDNANRIGYDAMRPLYDVAVTPEDAINRYGGEQGIKEHFMKDTSLMRTFLKINNKDVEDVVTRTETTLSDTEQKLRQHMIDSLGEDAVHEWEGVEIPKGSEKGIHRRQWVENHLDEIKDAYKSFMRSGTFHFSEEEVDNVISNMKLIEFVKLMRNAANFLNDGATTVKEEVDRKATDKLVKEAAEKNGYETWVNNLLDGIEEKQGIRNDKDAFTRQGNRRSWESLHEPVTLENVVKVMRSELAAGGNGIVGANPKGAAQKNYKNLDEIRSDEDRLQQLPEEEFKELEGSATQKLVDVCQDIVDSNPKRFDNKFGATLDVGEYVAEILNETRDKSSIHKRLQKDYTLKVTDEQMDALMGAIDEIANLPTGYFEAKPRRAVGFDEVKAAIIPASTDEDIKQGFSDRGIQMYEYDPDVEGDRTEKVNEAASEQDLRFSISEDLDEPYMAAVNAGNMEEAQEYVDEAAKRAGYTYRGYHGTAADFNVFETERSGQNWNGESRLGPGIYFAHTEESADKWSLGTRMINAYLSMKKPIDLREKTPDDLLPKVEEYYKKKLDDYEDWYPISRESYQKNLERLKGFDIDDPLSFLSHFKYDPDTEKMTDGMREVISELGYDGFISKDEMVVFDPAQVKSADTVTYAEDGSVIPLSQRFDPTNNDIRYSMSTEDADGNVLTTNQMEYFKNSQARDENGRLVPVYHTTNNGGFTIFDPSYSEDQRSIFFTDSEAISKTYGVKDSSTTYECYLNFENPLIVDADYNAWDRIPMTRRIGSITMTEDYDTIEVAAFAYAEGYDSVIIRNCRDWAVDDSSDFDTEENSPYSDIFIAFSSNQVKDTRNENPTENPDIRYSITEDEGKSQKDYDHAVSDDYETLEDYETMLADEDLNATFVDLSDEAFNREHFDKIVAKYEKKGGFDDAFYAALTDEVDSVFDDEYLEDGRMRMAKSKADFFDNLNTKWNERWQTGGEVLDIKSVKTNVRNLIRGVMNNSNTDRQYKTSLVNRTLLDMRTAYKYLQQGRTDIASALLYHSSLRMISDVDFIQDDTEYQEYKGIRDYLRGEPITIAEDYWQGKAFQQFRKEHYGLLKLRKGTASNIDKVYGQLEELYPHIFNETERSKHGFEDSEEDLLQYIGFVTEQNMQPFMEAYSSEECAEWAFEIADDLYEIMENGEGVTSLADRYKAKYDAKAKAMKTRHAEAILRVRKQKDAAIDALKEKYNERLDKQKELAKDAIRKEREKFRQQKQAEKEKTKERTLHKKYFDSIAKNHKKLTDRLLTNTKDKHIPEQYKKDLAELLAAFDLQTVASKKLEIKNGLYYRQNYQSQKTLRMKALQETLLNIQADSQLFYVNDSITEIIDRLLGKNAEGKTDKTKSVEGKAIDELTASELKDIDSLLKALIHEFNNYESVRVGVKRQQAADIATAQIDSCLDHAEKLGEGRDYQNFLGALDNIIGLDEMTPAYMFKQIDPQNNGIGLMFKELRRSFGKYVRNQNQLNEWMEEIIGEYHSKGKLWKKYGAEDLINWRISTRAKEFALTNGNVKLSPAQMMSVYCLSKRPQAYQHMVGAGIVVQPVSFMARMATDLKRKSNYALPIILTDADIKLITSRLTPDQIKVADKLQELMATKMAEWGNEASMSVMGIRLFDDPNYFPIKSDKAALEKDFSAEQFMDCIRNFGFTKAVQPGARNAIAVGDIFDVVAEHCNNMNLYNAYSEAMNDFMKVYNYHAMREDGSDYSVEQAIAHAYSKKATTFIRTFMKDLNGNVSKERTTGIEQMINNSLGSAKKASVFANGRVALQQPTSIMRAFAVISPKYLTKGVVAGKKTMQEMFEHSPIALWKSWGYYDINMGKSIEDLMMNNGSWTEDMMSDLYGKLDNRTWTVIWCMCKNEIEDKHKDVEKGSDEYWELVSERFDEVVDLTQVVDSPFHRSHAMRSKNTLVKMATAFMAEPTLTFNMVRDGMRRAKEEYRLGNKKAAGKIAGRTIAVFILSASATAAAAALWDAVRGKDPGDDDKEDKSFFDLWYANMLENLKDNINLFKNIYWVKDAWSLFEGWENSNLGMQGWIHLAYAFRQFKGDKVSSNLTWYENALAGFGYLSGIPTKTLMKDGKAVFKIFGLTTPQPLQDQLDKLDSFGQSTKDMNSGASSESGVSSSKKSAPTTEDESKSTSAKLWTYENAPFHIEDGSAADNFLNKFGINLTSAEIAAIERSEEEKEIDAKVKDIQSKTEGLSQEEKNQKVYSMVTRYMKDHQGAKPMADYIADGDFWSIGDIENMYIRAGGNADYFDDKVFKACKSAMKKTISTDNDESQKAAQSRIKDYLLQNGMTETELSDIAYKSYTKKDLQVAFLINDEDAIVTEMRALMEAGMSRDDIYKAYDNRKRIDLVKYKESEGKYADRLRSTGTYNWPCNGSITSHFGHRHSPGNGVGSTNHQGLDIGASYGSPVTASDGGVVVKASWYGGYGKTVQIQHDDGTITQYSHLSWWEPKVGDVVAQGQEIGKVGSTGNSTGPHLHFGVMKNGSYVDPMDYLNKKK